MKKLRKKGFNFRNINHLSNEDIFTFEVLKMDEKSYKIFLLNNILVYEQRGIPEFMVPNDKEFKRIILELPKDMKKI